MHASVLQSWLLEAKHLRWLLAGSVAWLLVALTAWWQIVYLSPERVFQTMLRQNFTISSVTRTISQSGEPAINRVAHIRLNGQPTIQVIESVTQNDRTQRSEYRLNRSQGYVRVLENYGAAVPSEWASLADTQAFAREVAENTYFPMASLDRTTRDEILRTIERHTVYHADYGTAAVEVIDGKDVYTYDVTVQLQAYVSMLKQFATAVGFTDLAEQLDPQPYAGSEPVKLRVSVNKYSGQLIRTKTATEPVTTERFSGYGLWTGAIAMPTEAITLEQLFQKLGQ